MYDVGTQTAKPNCQCQSSTRNGTFVMISSHMIQTVPNLTIINLIHCNQEFIVSFSGNEYQVKGCAEKALRTFARKFSNVDFFLQILPLKDDELVMSEM